MTYIGWPPRIAQKENVDVASVNYAFRKRVRVLQNAPRELANVETPNATARTKAKNLAEDSLLSIVEYQYSHFHIVNLFTPFNLSNADLSVIK
jgi:hypothetical protein